MSAAWVVLVVPRCGGIRSEAVVSDELNTIGNLLQLFRSKVIVVTNWFLMGLFSVVCTNLILVKIKGIDFLEFQWVS